jgi:formylglycine-generating enzyme required for sulfatase activity
MTDLSERCPGCMKRKGKVKICPACGHDESRPSAAVALPCKTLLHNQYWIGRILGKPGGFGITYLAWDTGLDKPVAIKEYFPAAFAGRDPLSKTVHPHFGEHAEIYAYGLQAFSKEAKTLARFDHPHIVKPLNVFEENGTAYLVMDYLEGDTLAAYLERQPGKRVGQARALEILLPIMQGLEQVHAQGFVHRDIKPLNIYLTRRAHEPCDERTILLDFGAARMTLSGQSRSLSVMYTPDFAAPEQQHTRGQGPWTDVYGLAATLYRMTTGVPPQQAVIRFIDDVLQDPRELAPELPERFAEALLSGLSLNPKQRPQTVAAFRALLTAAAARPLADPPPVAGPAPPPAPNPPILSEDPERTLPPQPRPAPVPEPPSGKAEPGKRPPKKPKSRLSKTGLGLAAALGLSAAASLWGPAILEKNGKKEGEPAATAEPSPATAARSSAASGKPATAASSDPAVKQETAIANVPAAPPAACDYCPELVAIPAGEFMMGSDERDKEASSDEKPRHRVKIQAFKLGKREVTKAQFAVFARETGHKATGCWTWGSGTWDFKADKDWRDPGFAQTDQAPAVCLSHEDAQAYIAWLNEKTGAAYRLPTEAEWEYAARAGTETIRYWGDAPDAACRYANVADLTLKRSMPSWPWQVHECSDGFVFTAPAGSFPPNRFGLHDMLGNVWEWTCSAYTERGYDEKESVCTKDASARRASRGGSWVGEPRLVRSALRDGAAPARRDGDLGFRLAQD